MELSPGARAGALADLAVLVPVLVVYEVLHGTGVITGDTGAAVVAGLAAVLAPHVGGIAAGRKSETSPLRTAAVATFVPILAFVIVRLIDAGVRGRTVTVTGLILVVMLSVAVGVIGGLIGGRLPA